MEFLDAIPVIGPALGIMIPFLLLLGVVVFVHEYGHYIVGRWCGIHAETFSIGFGKRLYSWVDSRGTRWQIAALPLGGFVKFVGDMDPASAGSVEDDKLTPEERKVAFHNASVARRAATVAAGPVFNFILSILLFACIAYSVGRDSNVPIVGKLDADATAEIGFQPGDKVLSLDGEEVGDFVQVLEILHKSNGRSMAAEVERDGQVQDIDVRFHNPPRVDAITPGMPAARAGMLPGDIILSINDAEVSSFFDLQLETADLPLETPIRVLIDRDGEQMTFTLTPVTTTRAHPISGDQVPQPTLGVRSVSRGGISAVKEGIGPFTALHSGANQTWSIISGTATYLGDMIFASADTSQLGGPIRIAEMSGERAAEGIVSFVWLIAVLSTSIGLLNLFPIPVLDGGHLMFYAIEALRGRPLKGAWMQVGTVIGLSLVLSLMVFATYNDISRFLAG